MAVIEYEALVGDVATDAVIPAGLARMAQRNLVSASRLHAGVGWGCRPTGDAALHTPKAWGPPWSWATVAALLVPLDGATTTRVVVVVADTDGTIRMRAGRSGDGVAVVDGTLTFDDAEVVPLSGGFGVVELQVLSTAGSPTTRSVTWHTPGEVSVASNPDGPLWITTGAYSHVLGERNGSNHHLAYPPQGAAEGSGDYSVSALGWTGLVAVYAHGTSDGISPAMVRGGYPIRAVELAAQTGGAQALLERTPRAQHLHPTKGPQLVWWRTNGAPLADDLPTEAADAYTLALLLATGETPAECEVLGIDVSVPLTTSEIGYSLPHGLLAHPWWTTHPRDLAFVTIEATNTGELTATLAGDEVAVVSALWVPRRTTDGATIVAPGTRIDELAPYLTAPDEPWEALRREVASWSELPDNGTAVGVWRSTPALLVKCVASATLASGDTVSVVVGSYGTITLTGPGAVEDELTVPGDTVIGIGVARTGTDTCALRVYEEHMPTPTSLTYADRATLLAATPETGSTGYVAAYDAATEVWRRTGSGWVVVAAVITDWDDRPPASDGGVMQWNAATYIGDEAVGEWVAAECAQHTRTLLDTIIGTESSAQLTSDGWTVATSNGGTVGTVNESSRDWVKFDTSAGNSATANVSRSLTSGDGIYMVGWCKCSTSTGSAGAHGMAPYIRDGSRVYDFEADRAGPGARWVNVTTVAGAVCDTDSLRGSAQVLEVYKRPNGDGGGAWARIDGGEWTQVVGLTQCATTASSDIYLGDSSGSGSTSTQWSEAKIVRLT
jgi:hypothetical protein